MTTEELKEKTGRIAAEYRIVTAAMEAWFAQLPIDNFTEPPRDAYHLALKRLWRACDELDTLRKAR